jgi:hypothetical protein
MRRCLQFWEDRKGPKAGRSRNETQKLSKSRGPMAGATRMVGAMKRIRDFLGGVAHISQSAIETDFVANCLKNQEVLLAVAEEVLKQQTMQSVALARLEAEVDRLKADLKRLEETMSQNTARNPQS